MFKMMNSNFARQAFGGQPQQSPMQTLMQQAQAPAPQAAPSPMLQNFFSQRQPQAPQMNQHQSAIMQGMNRGGGKGFNPWSQIGRMKFGF